METDTLHVREYEHADWETVRGWWDAHGGADTPLDERLLPPVGIMVERGGKPECALWCHLSVSCPVAFLANAVSKPGMGMKETGTVFGVAVEAMEAICRTHNYAVLVASTYPAIARWLERHSDFTQPIRKVQVLKVLCQ